MKARLLSIGKVLVGPLLLLLLLRLVGVQTLWATLHRAHPGFLLLALLAYFGTVALRGYRWGVLLRAQGIRVALPRLIALDFVGSFFNVVLPSSVGGDVVKWHELSQGRPASRARIASSLLADRICGLLVLLMMGAAVVPLAGAAVPPGLGALLAAVAGGSLLALAALLSPRLRGVAERRIPGLRWLLQRPGLRGVYASLDGYRGPALAHAAAASFAFNVVMIGVTVALGRAFGLTLALPLYAVVVPLVSLVLALPLSINGLGVRESGYLFFLGQVGVAPPVALSIGLAYYGCTVAAGLVGALLYLLDALRGVTRVSATPLPPIEG